MSNRLGEYSLTSLIGFYNFEGEQIIPLKYESSLFSGYAFNDGLWQFEDNDKKGFLNMKGEIAIAPKFYWSNDFKNNYAVVKLEKGGLCGVINKMEIVYFNLHFIFSQDTLQMDYA
ncbi:MAG: WG repeat-containing protein [Bacteroidetes bacterium]|nr:WG repeat-containing protein [Bacteroidota bacterium]